MDSARLTFVVTIRQGSDLTLENVATRERVALTGLDEIPARITAWAGPGASGGAITEPADAALGSGEMRI